MGLDPVLFSQQVERERRRRRRDFVSMLVVIATFLTLPLFGVGMLAGWNLVSVLLMVLGMFAVVAVIGSVVWLITSAGESVTKLFVEPGNNAPAPDGTSMAEAIAAKGDLAEASAAFDALRKAHGGDTVATLRVEAEMYSGPRGDPKKAKELFQRMRKAVDATRDDELYATHRLADLYFGPLGDTDRALAELRRIVQRFPGTRDAEGAAMAIERHRAMQQQAEGAFVTVQPIVIGLVSDTHGLVRPELFAALEGVSQIFHAGDVGPADVLAELSAIAPVRAVYGNTDAPGRPDLAERIEEVIDGVRIVVTHGHEISGGPTPPKLVSAYPTADVIVYGHTHQQLVVKAARRVVVNPGAAGPRRFKLQPCVAKLYIHRGQADVQLIPLLPPEIERPVDLLLSEE